MRPLGIGVDIAKNKRLLDILSKPTRSRFLEKALHPSEIKRFESFEIEKSKVEFIASRWAAKEALVKASQRKDIDFAGTGIRTLANGAPEFFFEQHVEKLLREEVGMEKVFLSLSHEDDYSIAFVSLYGK